VSIFERRQITALEKIFERRQITALEKFYSADFLPVLCVSAAEQLGPAELFGAGSLLGCAAAVSSVTTGRQTIFFVLFPFPVRWRSAHPGLRFLLHEPAATPIGLQRAALIFLLWSTPTCGYFVAHPSAGQGHRAQGPESLAVVAARHSV
jgi:hypothetical protein